MWHREFTIVADTTPAAVWQLFTDVEGWPRWNAGIERIALRGPFATGTEFGMKPPGQEEFTSRLVDVVPLRGFTDETVLGDVRVVVDHRIADLQDGQVQVTYAATVTGPQAEDIGEAVTGDFPQVLAALAECAAAGR